MHGADNDLNGLALLQLDLVLPECTPSAAEVGSHH